MKNATRSASVDTEDGEEKWVGKKDAKTDEADGDDVISATMRYKPAASLQL